MFIRNVSFSPQECHVSPCLKIHYHRLDTLPSFIAATATAKVGHQLTMPSLRGNRWAVKLGLLEDDSSELAMFKGPKGRVWKQMIAIWT